MVKNKYVFFILLFFSLFLNNKICSAQQYNIVLKNVSTFPIFYYENDNAKTNIIAFQGTHGTRTLDSLDIPPLKKISKIFYLKKYNFFQFPNKKHKEPLFPEDRIKIKELNRINNLHNYLKEKYKNNKNVFLAHHYGALSVMEYINNFGDSKLDAIIFLSFPYTVNNFFDKKYSLKSLKKLFQKEIPILFLFNTNDKCDEIKIDQMQLFLNKISNNNFKIKILSSSINQDEKLCSHRSPHGFMGAENDVSNEVDIWLKSIF